MGILASFKSLFSKIVPAAIFLLATITGLVAKLFAYKGMSKTFKDKVSEYIVTSAEKSAVMMMIKKGNYNDYEKIRFIENYTGHKMK